MVPVKFIYASTPDGVIGDKNQLPWQLKEDLQLFKQKTLFGTVMMGSKTYDSLPPSMRPLPNRESVIVSSQKAKYSPFGQVISDPIAFIKKSNKPIWVIGGASLFEQVKQYCSEIHHTEVGLQIDGDTRFEMDLRGWKTTADTGPLKAANDLSYRVRVYQLPLVLLPV